MTTLDPRAAAVLETFNRFETFHGYNDGTVWTASRCLRMLRPLQTALHKLDKDVLLGHRIGPLLEECPKKRRYGKDIDKEITAAEALANIQDQLNTRRDDPDFQPSEPAARFRKTYSTRRQKYRGQDDKNYPEDEYGAKLVGAQAGDTAMFIPFDLGPVGLYNADCRYHSQDDRGIISAAQFKRMEKNIAENRTGTKLGGYRAVYIALDHILKASDIKGPDIHDLESPNSQSDNDPFRVLAKLELERWYMRRDNCGARSLFKMCLNRLPSVVALEQESDNNEPEHDRSDATSDLYRQLEDFSTNKDNGWRPLRDLLRAQSITMLCDKIRTGLLAQRTILEAFVELCKVRHHFHGAQLLLSAWIDAIADRKLREDAWRLRDRKQTRHHLIEIHKLSQELDCEHMFWGWITKVAENGKVDFQDSYFYAFTWARALHRLFKGSEVEREAVISMLERLITCAVTKLVVDLGDFAMLRVLEGSGIPTVKTVESLASEMKSHEKVTQTFPTALSAILTCLFRIIQGRHAGEDLAIHVIRRLISHTERLLYINLRPNLDFMQVYSAVLPWWTAVLAAILCKTDKLDEALDLTAFISLLEVVPNDDVACLLGKHTNLVALNCARKETTEGLHTIAKAYLQIMTGHLLDLTRNRGLKIFAQVACTAAFEFTELYPSKSNADFVVQVEIESESLEQAIDALRSDSQDSGATDEGTVSSDAAQYYWDDSVSEFVQAPTSTQTSSQICTQPSAQSSSQPSSQPSTQHQAISVVVPKLSQTQANTYDAPEHHAVQWKEPPSFQFPMVLVPLPRPSAPAAQKGWAGNKLRKRKSLDDDYKERRVLIKREGTWRGRTRGRSLNESISRLTTRESKEEDAPENESEDELAM